MKGDSDNSTQRRLHGLLMSHATIGSMHYQMQVFFFVVFYDLVVFAHASSSLVENNWLQPANLHTSTYNRSLAMPIHNEVIRRVSFGLNDAQNKATNQNRRYLHKPVWLSLNHFNCLRYKPASNKIAEAALSDIMAGAILHVLFSLKNP